MVSQKDLDELVTIATSGESQAEPVTVAEDAFIRGGVSPGTTPINIRKLEDYMLTFNHSLNSAQARTYLAKHLTRHGQHYLIDPSTLTIDLNKMTSHNFEKLYGPRKERNKV